MAIVKFLLFLLLQIFIIIVVGIGLTHGLYYISQPSTISVVGGIACLFMSFSMSLLDFTWVISMIENHIQK